MKCLRRTLLLVLMGLFACAPAQAAEVPCPGEACGKARVYLDAESQWETDVKAFWPGLTKSGKEKEEAEEKLETWMGKHFSLIKAYIFPGNPSAQWAVKSGVPVIAYIDAATESYTDSQGHQVRFSPLNEAARHAYVKKTEKLVKEEGASGIFMDDVNWTCDYRDWTQEGGEESKVSKAECEAKDGEPEMKEEATLIKEVRTALRSGKIIDINSHYSDYAPLWSGGVKPNANFLTAVENVNLIHQEFGVGPESGINSRSGYEGFINFVLQMHERTAKQVNVVLAGAFKREKEAREKGEVAKLTQLLEYELASFYLINNGFDDVGSETALADTPEHFWRGFCAGGKDDETGKCSVNVGNLDLGNIIWWYLARPSAEEEAAGQHWYRRFWFYKGAVVNPPGGKAHAFRVGEAGHVAESTEWGALTEPTVGVERGGVFH